MKICIPLVLTCLAFGCYTFSGGQVPFKTVSVPAAVNSTAEFRLSELVTKSLMTAIEKDGRLKMAEPRTAQGRYEIEVIDYQRQPYVYDRQEVVSQYKVTITAKVSLRSQSGRNVWEGTEIKGWAIYSPGSEDEAYGMEKAAGNLAEEIVRQSLETW